MTTTPQAILIGVVVVLAGTLPRNLLFAANLQYWPAVPWAVPAIVVYLWIFWRYLQGAGPPATTAAQRRVSLRANPLSRQVWLWSLTAGGLGILALVLALRVVNRFVALPEQQLPDLAQVPAFTVLALLLTAAPVAGIVEEAAFRGYMQGPLEKRYGLVLALLITGTMFAVVHLDFTPILWPYYVTVTAIYGTVAYLTNSILPSVVLHTCGNLYSNLDLWIRGRAEWQASSGDSAVVANRHANWAILPACLLLLVIVIATVAAYVMLARVARQQPGAVSVEHEADSGLRW